MKKFKIRMFIVLTSIQGMQFISPCIAAEDAFIISQQRYVHISPIFQSWAADQGETISEFSTLAMVYFPLNDRMGMSVMSSQAMVSSDISTKLSGLTDTQVNMNYYSEKISTLVSLGVNLPTGKKMLTANQFTTSYLISLKQYNFRVPNFGQGLNISPGLSWAYPVRETFVIGIGISYQYRGPFTPFESMTGQYDPGEEILITGGADLRISETATCAADIVYTSYGKDKLDGQETFQSGNKFITTVQLKINAGYNEFRLLGCYRTKDKNQIAIAGGFLPDEQKTIPDQLDILGQYRFRWGQGHYTSLIGEMRFYNKTSIWGKTNILTLGVAPEFTLSPRVRMPVRLKYSIGNIDNGSKLSGIEIGLGLHFAF